MVEFRRFLAIVIGQGLQETCVQTAHCLGKCGPVDIPAEHRLDALLARAGQRALRIQQIQYAAYSRLVAPKRNLCRLLRTVQQNGGSAQRLRCGGQVLVGRPDVQRNLQVHLFQLGIFGIDLGLGRAHLVGCCKSGEQRNAQIDADRSSVGIDTSIIVLI